MANVGFVGLGVMGGGIAARLLAAGHTVAGWNRTRSKAATLEAQGLVWCDSPREVAECAETVFTMVTDVSALDAVLDGGQRARSVSLSPLRSLRLISSC